MNRLILIGNGFDLSHELKTSYSDFLYWYLKNVMNQFYVESIYEDCLLKLKNLSYGFSGRIPQMNDLEQTIIVYQNLIKNSRNSSLNIHFKSQLFREVFEKAKINYRWVDFENHYFDYLRRYGKIVNYNKESIRVLNEEFEYLKIKLRDYLCEISKEKIKQSPDKFMHLSNLFAKNEFIDAHEEIGELPKNIYVVNFNYTPTFKIYAEKLNAFIPTEVNHIHGELQNEGNPIIFGYGDEHDKEYLSFEEKQNNELFKHIKSFQYLKTSNYQNLIRFINSDDYQVCILGHSCGLSDRTMLKEIFENDKCKSIKIYYYQWGNGKNENDYVEKTYEISRHFSSKGEMRKKVVSFDKCESL